MRGLTIAPLTTNPSARTASEKRPTFIPSAMPPTVGESMERVVSFVSDQLSLLPSALMIILACSQISYDLFKVTVFTKLLGSRERLNRLRASAGPPVPSNHARESARDSDAPPNSPACRPDTCGMEGSLAPGSNVAFSSNPYIAPSTHPPPSRLAPPTTPSPDSPPECALLENSSAPSELEDGGAEDHVIPVDDVVLDGSEPFDITGHFSDLFVGTHKSGVKVAMKRLRIGKRSSHGPEILKLEHEAAMWLPLEHSYVLRFMGLYRANDYTYLVSPFMENGNLADYIRRYPDRERTSFILEAADAVAFLHAKGVVHSDIKARNILVSESHHALLCDFGLAKDASSITASTSKGQGSLRWQSPEVVNGVSRSFASDTYAFGITISEVLSGTIPFPHLKGEFNVFMAVCVGGERPARSPPHSRTGEPYQKLWTIAAQCWDKEPQRRPGMSDVYSQLCGGCPTSAEDASEGSQSGESSPTDSFFTALGENFDDDGPTPDEVTSQLEPRPSTVPPSLSPRTPRRNSLDAAINFLSFHRLSGPYGLGSILAAIYIVLAYRHSQTLRIAQANAKPGDILPNKLLSDEYGYTASHGGGSFRYAALEPFLGVQRTCGANEYSNASLSFEVLPDYLPHGGLEKG